MRIIKDTFAVFWKPKGETCIGFHADVAAKTAIEAAKTFRDMFPDDVILSIRDKSGRFMKFKE